MTIRVHLHDGNKVRTQVYRSVHKGKSYAQLVENFYSFKNDMKWGIMVQLRGEDRIFLHTFGSPEVDSYYLQNILKAKLK